MLSDGDDRRFHEALDRWITREPPEDEEPTEEELEEQKKRDEEMHEDAHAMGWCKCKEFKPKEKYTRILGSGTAFVTKKIKGLHHG